jgi:hypothetical protein
MPLGIGQEQSQKTHRSDLHGNPLVIAMKIAGTHIGDVQAVKIAAQYLYEAESTTASHFSHGLGRDTRSSSPTGVFVVGNELQQQDVLDFLTQVWQAAVSGTDLPSL